MMLLSELNDYDLMSLRKEIELLSDPNRNNLDAVARWLRTDGDFILRESDARLIESAISLLDDFLACVDAQLLFNTNNA